MKIYLNILCNLPFSHLAVKGNFIPCLCWKPCCTRDNEHFTRYFLDEEITRDEEISIPDTFHRIKSCERLINFNVFFLLAVYRMAKKHSPFALIQGMHPVQEKTTLKVIHDQPNPDFTTQFWEPTIHSTRSTERTRMDSMSRMGRRFRQKTRLVEFKGLGCPYFLKVHQGQFQQ